jgi:hypothetical protein
MQLPALRFRRPTFGDWTAGPPEKVHCELDDWWFDARYTDGACPICGWRPDGLTYAAPVWLRAFRRMDWELAGLLITVLLLVLLGILVERAAGLTPGDLGGFLSGR